MDNFGLVFSGGGGRGAYQIGVWKALDKLGLASQVKAVSGTSVGALNAAMFVSISPSAAEAIWTGLSRKDILNIRELTKITKKGISKGIAKAVSLYSNPNTKQLASVYCEKKIIEKSVSAAKKSFRIIRKEGLFSQDGLKALIRENGVAAGVMKSSIPCFACRQKNKGESKEVEYVLLNGLRSEEEIVNALADSSCLPFVFHAQKHDDNKYYDGGLEDNCPIEPLYKLLTATGERAKIVVVLLKPNAKVDTTLYPNADFIIIRPKETIFLGSSQLKYIDDGLVDFKGKHARTRIQLGYYDAIEAFGNEGYFPKQKTENPAGEVAKICSRYIRECSDDWKFSAGQETVQNAVEQYASHLNPDEVLAVLGSSPLGVGQDGLLLTKDSLVVAQPIGCMTFPFSSIAAVEVKRFKPPDGSEIPEKTKLVIYTKDGKRVKNVIAGCNRTKLQEMLYEIIDLYHAVIWANHNKHKDYHDLGTTLKGVMAMKSLFCRQDILDEDKEYVDYLEAKKDEIIRDESEDRQELKDNLKNSTDEELQIYIPKVFQKDIYSIDYKLLKANGIKLLTFDIDDTIDDSIINKVESAIPGKKVTMPQQSVELFAYLKSLGFKVALLTNAWDKVAIDVCNQLNADGYIAKAHKPDTTNFFNMMERFGVKPTEMAHIGNSITDDIVGGNRAGVTTCLVRRAGFSLKVVKSFMKLVGKQTKGHIIREELKQRNLWYKHHQQTKGDQYYQLGEKPKYMQ